MMIWLSLKGVLLTLLFAWHAKSVFSCQVQTDLGTFQGTVVTFHHTFHSMANFDRVYQFLGIPYAKPPIGELRFKKPQPVDRHEGIFIADKMPQACIQVNRYPFPWYDNGTNSEDCLYLNIWVPEDRYENLPVMFWIYGGGFTVGSNRQKVYDGRALAAKGGVVVVTINYRLGVFGFLTSGTDEAPGNYGMYDMLEALKWVNKYIAAFGGDPNKVTLVGQSAGSISIGLLCVSPLTKGLFHRVIMQSGSPAYTLADNVTLESVERSQELAKDFYCANDENTISNNPVQTLRCLRGINATALAEKLQSKHPTSARSFFPRYGDEFLPKNARQALIDGDFHNVPVLIGNNADEGSFQLTTGNPYFWGFFGEHRDALRFEGARDYAESQLNATFNKFHPKAVIDYYLGNLSGIQDSDMIRHQMFTAMGDWSLLCPTVFFAESYSRRGNNVYYYYFTHRPSISPWAPWMGTVHFEEVQFVFGQPLQSHKYRIDEVLLSDKMVDIWTSFVKYGTPGIAYWPRYYKKNPVYLKLDIGRHEYVQRYRRFGYGPNKANCDFFRKYFGFQ